MVRLPEPTMRVRWALCSNHAIFGWKREVVGLIKARTSRRGRLAAISISFSTAGGSVMESVPTNNLKLPSSKNSSNTSSSSRLFTPLAFAHAKTAPPRVAPIDSMSRCSSR